MLYLILSVLCSVMIANLLKLFRLRYPVPILHIFLGNYLFAALFSYGIKPFAFNSLGPLELILGGITGLLFLVNFLLYERNIRLNGISLSVAAMRVSLLVPTLVSLFLFHEHISTSNAIGIAVVVAALAAGRRLAVTHVFWLLLLFVLTGITDTSMKVYEVYGRWPENVFLAVVFASAFLVNGAVVLARRATLRPRALLLGVILGLPNQLTSLFLLKALGQLPGAIVYPLSASAIVLVSVVSDVTIWRTRLKRNQVLFLLAIIAGIVLLNIR